MRVAMRYFGVFFSLTLVLHANADVVPAPTAAGGGRVQRPEDTIFGQLPKDCTVQAVGTYHATADVNDVQLDRSGQRVRQAEVVVNVTDRPVVLVLTAYEPTVWRVGLTAKTKLVGVIVSGYHGQALLGVPKQIPHVVSSHEAGGPFKPFYAYGASPALLAMNRAVKRLVGQEIDHFEFRPTRGVFNVGPAPKIPAEVIYSDELKASDFADQPKPIVAPQPDGALKPAAIGQQGIDQLVKDGKLRLATPDEVNAWIDKASEKYRRFNPELRVEPSIVMRWTYVVQGPLTLPDGLTGAHKRDFIVPEGAPEPRGEKGHCTFFYADGTARGPLAERELE
jgi:hypothetical protein